MMSVSLRNLGIISYRKGLSLQMELVDQYKSQDIKSVGEVLMCQHHPTVYTLGLREKNDIELTDRLKRVGADVVKTRRGGLTTCHSVGQLICYPILNLRKLKIGPRQYIHSLERAVITTCNILDVIAHTTDNVGVWIGNDKVCAIGVQISYGVSYHGLALNCCNDLSWFDYIVPCGLEGKTVTSLTKLRKSKTEVNDVIPILINSLSNELNLSIS